MHSRAVPIDMGQVCMQRVMHVDMGCVNARARASELASWHRAMSMGLKTRGYTKMSTECNLQKQEVGKMLNARQPACW